MFCPLNFGDGHEMIYPDLKIKKFGSRKETNFLYFWLLTITQDRIWKCFIKNSENFEKKPKKIKFSPF